MNETPKINPWRDGRASNIRCGEAIWTIFKQSLVRKYTTLPIRPRLSSKAKSIDIAKTLIFWMLLLPLVFSWNTSPKTRRSFFQVLSFSTLFPVDVKASNLPKSYSVDTSKSGTVEALIPVIRLEAALLKLNAQISDDFEEFLRDPNHLLGTIPTQESSFKGLFDAYSDPVSYKQKFLDSNAFLVYYSKGFDGPGRPSIESDLPTKQTYQYGARNEAWIAWDQFLAERDFAIQNPKESGPGDLKVPLQKTIDAIDAYLSQASTLDVQLAQSRIK